MTNLCLPHPFGRCNHLALRRSFPKKIMAISADGESERHFYALEPNCGENSDGKLVECKFKV